MFLTGFLEPVLYLFSIGVGVGQMIDGFTFNGRFVSYAAFVAPAMLAASAMNGAILDSTFGIFFKLRYDKVYEGVLATPMRTGAFLRLSSFQRRWIAAVTDDGSMTSPSRIAPGGSATWPKLVSRGGSLSSSSATRTALVPMSRPIRRRAMRRSPLRCRRR